jgi:hypothetical protein
MLPTLAAKTKSPCTARPDPGGTPVPRRPGGHPWASVSIRAQAQWRIRLRLCDTFGSSRNPKPGWRNWQTQQTQNLPTLVVMGVRPPLPALFKSFRINHLLDFVISCPCRVRMERCLIVAHLYSGKRSYTGTLKYRGSRYLLTAKQLPNRRPFAPNEELSCRKSLPRSCQSGYTRQFGRNCKIGPGWNWRRALD